MQILIWGDNMNRKVSICILVFIFIVCAVVLFVMAKRSKDAPIPETKVTQLAETEDASVSVNTDHVKQFRFIARIVDERLVIFESDGKTVYFETGIKEEALSEPIRQQAQHGIGFTTEAGMYDFLECYSS